MVPTSSGPVSATAGVMRRQMGIRSALLVAMIAAAVTVPPTLRAAGAQMNARGATPQQLAAQGNTALEERRFADALTAFTEASRLLPSDPTLHFLVGYASVQLGQLTEARLAFERALAREPRLTHASTGLGLVLYRQGKVAEAVKVLEAGLKYAPDDRDLKDLLAKWRPELTLQTGMYEARGAHFSVLFQGPSDDAMARRIVELLEEAYWRIGQALSTYPTEAISVVLYTQEQFNSTGGAPDWAGALYDGRIKIPTKGALQRPDELKSTLAHEFTHAVVAQLTGAAPIWLNEGLAEFMESDDFGRVERVLSHYPKRLPHSRLERHFEGLSSDDLALAYAQSAMAVKKMIELRGMSAVVTLLQALGRGHRFETAFQQHIAMRYEDFVAMMARY